MRQTTSKHLEANFKNLLGMKLVTDVVFLVLSSEYNDWTIYVFATGVGCKIRSAGSTKLKNVPYLSYRPTRYNQRQCQRNFNALIKDLDVQFPGGDLKISNLKKLLLW